MTNINRPSVQARNRQLIAGIGKRLQNVQSLAIAGATYTPADLVKLFQSQIDKADAVAPAKAKYQDAMNAYVDETKRLSAVVVGFRQQIRNLFGNAAEALMDFGIAPPKARTPKLVTRVSAAEKRAATRAARGTKGARQKKAIKGAPKATPATPPPAKPTA